MLVSKHLKIRVDGNANFKIGSLRWLTPPTPQFLVFSANKGGTYTLNTSIESPEFALSDDIE